MINVNNKIVAITGGSGLIGSSFAKSIVSNGGRVVIGDIDKDKGLSLQNEIGDTNSIFVYVDVTSPSSVENFIKEGCNHFGNITSAIHCAYPKSKQWGTRFEDLKSEYLKDDLYNQLGGAILFSQKIIKYFIDNNGGNLIHLSSIQGVAPPKFSHYHGTKMVSPIEYSAIKSGIISITKYLSKLYKNHSINVNCISPGGVLDGQPEEFLEKYRKSCSSKGMLDPIDLEWIVMFLLSDESRFINGQNIVIDDGWTL